MDAGCISAQQVSQVSDPRQSGRKYGRTLYRVGLLLVGIAWVCIASTFCGCARTNARLMNASGRGYYKKGNYTAARYEFERALLDDPYNANYAYNVAKAMEMQGDTNAAERMYQHALTIDPAHQPTYHDLSTMLVDQGRQQDAQSLMTAWAETQPYNPAAQVEMGRIDREFGNLPGAEQRLQTALAMNPKNHQALNQMAELNIQQGRNDVAANYYMRSLKMRGHQPEVSSRMYQMAMSTVPDGGIQLANNMVQSDPTMQGGTVLANYRTGGNLGGPMMGPQPMGSPMMAPQTFESQPIMMPSQPMPSGQPMMMPGNTIPQGQPMMTPSQPMQSGPQMNVPVPNPVLPPGQGGTSTMYYSPSPSMAPSHSPMMAPQPMTMQPGMQPVELGQPVPITQFYPQYGQPQYGQPHFGQPQFGQPHMAQPMYGQPQMGHAPHGQPLMMATPPAIQPF